MFKLVIAPAMLGLVLSFTGITLMNADEIMRSNCLEQATCYNPDRLK